MGQSLKRGKAKTLHLWKRESKIISKGYVKNMDEKKQLTKIENKVYQRDTALECLKSEEEEKKEK